MTSAELFLPEVRDPLLKSVSMVMAESGEEGLKAVLVVRGGEERRFERSVLMDSTSSSGKDAATGCFAPTLTRRGGEDAAAAYERPGIGDVEEGSDPSSRED